MISMFETLQWINVKLLEVSSSFVFHSETKGIPQPFKRRHLYIFNITIQMKLHELVNLVIQGLSSQKSVN